MEEMSSTRNAALADALDEMKITELQTRRIRKIALRTCCCKTMLAGMNDCRPISRFSIDFRVARDPGTIHPDP
jgi:hypothetical protein